MKPGDKVKWREHETFIVCLREGGRPVIIYKNGWLWTENNPERNDMVVDSIDDSLINDKDRYYYVSMDELTLIELKSEKPYYIIH